MGRGSKKKQKRNKMNTAGLKRKEGWGMIRMGCGQAGMGRCAL